MIPDFDIKILSTDSDSTILSLHNGKMMVLDFWHTKCKNCPLALEKLNKLASKNPNILYVACALSQGIGNEELVKDVIDEWDNLTHIFVNVELKEYLKQVFNFKQVPFVVVIDQVILKLNFDHYFH
jgi:thiol-disulfide isomerase/thioredoxin